jgi:hypothetical protein
MVFSEVDLLLHLQIIRIHLRIKAVILFEHTCQGSYPSVDTTPVCYAFAGVDFWYYVFEMLLAERLYRSTLRNVRWS